jgi:ATP-dependent DNA helicase RecG
MARKAEYKGISKRARMLLDGQEGYDVEFKASMNQVDHRDIVAFANSEAGGTILVGVEEIKTELGLQKGRVVGCNVGDREKQSILSKAENCVPPIDIEVILENRNRTPFFRVEIPSGSQKPYCTTGGTYKIRGDGRTKSLLPGRLLYMFLESESREFIERFRAATVGLEIGLMDIRHKIEEEMRDLLKTVQSMELSIDDSLYRIFSAAETAEGLSDEAMSLSDQTLDGIDQVYLKLEKMDNGSIDYVSEQIGAVLEHFGIEEPHIKQTRLLIEYEVEMMHNEGVGDDEILGKLQRRWNGDMSLLPWHVVQKWTTDKLADLAND